LSNNKPIVHKGLAIDLPRTSCLEGPRAKADLVLSWNHPRGMNSQSWNHGREVKSYHLFCMCLTCQTCTCGGSSTQAESILTHFDYYYYYYYKKKSKLESHHNLSVNMLQGVKHCVTTI
jgi:hypothetical protein